MSQSILNYGYTGMTPGANFVDTVTTTEYTLNGLEPETQYDIFIRSFCDEDWLSSWSPSATFTTQQGLGNGQPEANSHYTLRPNPASRSTTGLLIGTARNSINTIPHNKTSPMALSMPMIIAYQDTLMHLCPAKLRNTLQVPPHCTVIEDSELARAFDLLTAGEGDIWVWIADNPRLLVEALRRRFRMVKAAGGLVTAPNGDCLMIEREGHWDLPKGMVERGETLHQAALREVTEETGIAAQPDPSLIIKTYHIYDKYGGWHLKQTSWYAMRSQRLQTHPQTEESISQAVWVPRQECLQRLQTSFASLRLVAQAAHNINTTAK